jgi:flagellar basal-body rod modification protein FlgD
MATNPVSHGSTAAAAAASSSSGASSSSSTGSSQSPEATKQEFISLLVAQLQNQDPLNPSDGTQFLSQLTEINSFEQLLYIRQDLDQVTGQDTPTSASGSSPGSSTPGSSGAAAASGSQLPN